MVLANTTGTKAMTISNGPPLLKGNCSGNFETPLSGDDSNGMELVVLAAKQMSGKVDRQTAKIKELVGFLDQCFEAQNSLQILDLENAKKEISDTEIVRRELEDELSKIRQNYQQLHADLDSLKKDRIRFESAAHSLEKFKKDIELRESHCISNLEKLSLEAASLRNSKEENLKLIGENKQLIAELLEKINSNAIDHASISAHLTHSQRTVETQLEEIKSLRESLAAQTIKYETLSQENMLNHVSMVKERDALQFELSSTKQSLADIQATYAQALASHALAITAATQAHTNEMSALQRTHAASQAAQDARAASLIDSLRADWNNERAQLRADADARISSEIASREARVRELCEEIVGLRCVIESSRTEVREVERALADSRALCAACERELMQSREKVQLLEAQAEMGHSKFEAEIREIRAENQTLSKKVEALHSSKGLSDSRCNELASNLARITAVMSEKDNEIAKLQAEREALQDSVAQFKTSIHQMKIEIESVVEDSAKNLREINLAHDQEVAKIRADGEDSKQKLKATHAVEVFRIAEENEAALEKIGHEWKSKLEEQIEMKNKATEEAREQFELKLKSVVLEHERNRIELESTYNHKIAAERESAKRNECGMHQAQSDTEKRLEEKTKEKEALELKIRTLEEQVAKRLRIHLTPPRITETLQSESTLTTKELSAANMTQATVTATYELSIAQMTTELNDLHKEIETLSLKLNSAETKELESRRLAANLQVSSSVQIPDEESLSRNLSMAEQKSAMEADFREITCRTELATKSNIANIKKSHDETISLQSREFEGKIREFETKNILLQNQVAQLTLSLQQHQEQELKHQQQQERLKLLQLQNSVVSNTFVAFDSPRPLTTSEQPTTFQTFTPNGSKRMEKPTPEKFSSTKQPNVLTPSKRLRFEADAFEIRKSIQNSQEVHDEIVDDPITSPVKIFFKAADFLTFVYTDVWKTSRSNKSEVYAQLAVEGSVKRVGGQGSLKAMRRGGKSKVGASGGRTFIVKDTAAEGEFDEYEFRDLDRRHSITQKLRRSPIDFVPAESSHTLPIQGANASATVTAVDFNEVSLTVSVQGVDSLASFLLEDRPAHSKVRWINVNTMSLDVVKILGKHYGLHPLAIEDVFHTPQRIKADFYQDHIYVSMLLPILAHPASASANESAWESRLPAKRTATVSELPSLFFGHDSLLRKSKSLSKKRLAALLRPDAFLNECSLFLCENGVILSFWETSDREITDTVLSALAGSSVRCDPGQSVEKFVSSIQSSPWDPSRLTKLRTLCDASLVMHAIMDGIVDKYFELTQFYDAQLTVVEDLVLEKPKSDYTRALHLMLKELSALKRRLQPTESLLETLREDEFEDEILERVRKQTGVSTGRKISFVTKIYLKDIQDHCLTVLDELNALEQTAKGLIDLVGQSMRCGGIRIMLCLQTFNTISHRTENNMKLLSVVSFIFLPITFLAGVFGMNFTYFPELHFDIGKETQAGGGRCVLLLGVLLGDSGVLRGWVVADGAFVRVVKRKMNITLREADQGRRSHRTRHRRAGEFGGADADDDAAARLCETRWRTPTPAAAQPTTCGITAVDFDAASLAVAVLADAAALREFLQRPRPAAGSAVRWVNVPSMCAGALAALKDAYGLHPLAVEDVFHAPQRIKADLYQDHLYVSLLLPMLCRPADSSALPGDGAGTHTSLLPAPAVADGNSDVLPALFSGHDNLLRKAGALPRPGRAALVRPDAFVNECSLFLCADGVILSLWEANCREITDAVMNNLAGLSPGSSANETLEDFVARVRACDADPARLTKLRRKCDASLVMHALMDGIVDKYFELTKFYDEQLTVMEELVLEKPKAGYTRALHLILKELSTLKRRLQPTENLVRTLRDDNKQDHCMTVVEELNALEQWASGLIDLTFNTVSHRTENSMKLLSVISFIFLPITFVAGVFG
ncbi:hypothetical protein HDU84_005472 [Entophlyctis sp. JEL0112]|nr:hypothetical protein HDU84_005472 [Entophlyctis sp. JEL0112]